MTDIERKAQAMLNDARDAHVNPDDYLVGYTALCRAIEQHEAFKQEVSDAVADAKFMIETHCDEEASTLLNNRLSRFIIPAPKPDPLDEIMGEFLWSPKATDDLRAALEARGLEIRRKTNDR